MDADLMKLLGGWGLILAPAAIVAVIMLSIAAKGLLRGGVAAATGAFLLAVAAVVGIGAGATYLMREDALERVIPECEAKQREAHQRGEALLLDCETEGLIVVFPILSTVAATILVIFGAIVMRVMRRRPE